MIQNCKFFGVSSFKKGWERIVLININKDCAYASVVKELAKNGIFIAGCTVAAPASIIFDDAPEDCIVTGSEDDGTIYFSQRNILHVHWVPGFIDVLIKISDFVNK